MPDDRIIDGLYAGQAIKLMKTYVENPDLLAVPKMTDEDARREMGLTARGGKLFVSP